MVIRREQEINSDPLFNTDYQQPIRLARLDGYCAFTERTLHERVPWQRCQFHLQQNATHYVPKMDMRSEVASDLRAVFNAADRSEADRLLAKAVEKYRESAPKLAQWMEENVPEGHTVFRLPPALRRRLRTSNMLERLSQEIKRRTRVATLFPNEASLLRLVSAVLIEISEEWETGKRYLTLEPENQNPEQRRG
jgi:putative transposase